MSLGSKDLWKLATLEPLINWEPVSNVSVYISVISTGSDSCSECIRHVGLSHLFSDFCLPFAFNGNANTVLHI